MMNTPVRFPYFSMNGKRSEWANRNELLPKENKIEAEIAQKYAAIATINNEERQGGNQIAMQCSATTMNARAEQPNTRQCLAGESAAQQEHTNERELAIEGGGNGTGRHEEAR